MKLVDAIVSGNFFNKNDPLELTTKMWPELEILLEDEFGFSLSDFSFNLNAGLFHIGDLISFDYYLNSDFYLEKENLLRKSRAEFITEASKFCFYSKRGYKQIQLRYESVEDESYIKFNIKTVEINGHETMTIALPGTFTPIPVIVEMWSCNIQEYYFNDISSAYRDLRKIYLSDNSLMTTSAYLNNLKGALSCSREEGELSLTETAEGRLSLKRENG